MFLFENGDPEEFLLFVRNFSMTLVVSGTLEMGANIQYLCPLVRGKVLHNFDLFSADMEMMETLNV